MYKDSSLTRPTHRITPSNENEFESSCIQIPSRAPLISIPDPSQCQSKTSSQHDFKEKSDLSKASASKKSDGNMETQLISSLPETPKVYGRKKTIHSEPNSAQSTPIRLGPRISIASAASGCTLTRLPSQLGNGGGGRGNVLPRVSRGISVSVPQLFSADVPRFELYDDPSFWKDHNVQVLIRVRPLNDNEVISQGYGRCLRQENGQTVVWQGHPETRFTFDHIACENISQEKLFRVAGLPMVDNCMSGYNSCMFAYGQTGSGKTYTMMGEIDTMDGDLSYDCGITPRVFEYLFTRITEEEESRKHERLTYSCKCSFLEIYNEQITDLLEPSSTNLQLREDRKKGVFVENLTEYNVRTVNDVIQLLQQGAVNRKIAATYMNSESSRSHSVFTCVIESRWEKDSVAHLRFGRLNLVDLAGSERQKSSGAEGDRLKEAANINKSLSTLGLVIMSLVHLAQGKDRHIPYRDSRLTFLLQDSLGGNSKTTIIANVSSSICSASETLSTLKFAKRAKLIQNNAKINEDASGSVTALQHQIEQLKDQLSFVMKHQHTSIECIDFVPEQATLGQFSESYEQTEEMNIYDEHNTSKGVTMTAYQQEDECRHSNSILKFREEKIKRLELLLDGSVSVDKFYLDENNALREENLLLQDKIRKYSEVDRTASCNLSGHAVHYSENDDKTTDADYLIENPHLTRMLNALEIEQMELGNCKRTQSGSGARDPIMSSESSDCTGTSALQTKFEKLSKDLKEAQLLNIRYMEDHETRVSQDQQTELIRSEVEMETTRTIIQLQGEIDRLQSEFQESLCSVAEENLSLRNSMAAKEDELRESRTEWERAILELTTFLVNGSTSLRDASREIKSISSFFPKISEHVERAAKQCIEKEETILLLQKSLEDAQNDMTQMEQKILFLKDATIALSEFQQSEKFSSVEEIQLFRMASDSIGVKEFSENKLISPLAYTNAFVGKNLRHDEIQFGIRETSNILSLLEDCFFTTRTNMEELSRTARIDADQVVEKLLTLCFSFRSSLEDLICKVMQNDICTFVIQCQMGEFSLDVRSLNTISNPDRPTLPEHFRVRDDLFVSQEDNSDLQAEKFERKENDLDLFDGDNVDKKSELMRELEHKEVLLKGLLFDFSLLQEFASQRTDIKDELEKLIFAMRKVQHELQTKTVQLDDALVQNKKLEGCLSEAEKALLDSSSELSHAKEALHVLSERNVELKDLLKNLYLKNSEAEQLVEDQKEAIQNLEDEIIRVSSKRLGSSMDDIEDALAEAVGERDQLVEKLACLQDKLDQAFALADENQAIAVEARQESETCKLYAEEKEEEVKILENSIQELESTVNVLEKKVHEMEEEVQEQGMIRDSLELELQSLRQRLSTVEDFTESMTSAENFSTVLSEDHISRSLEIKEARSRIRLLEEENGKQAKEIRQFKDYISELVLHSEAQASQYQQKYKFLEAMVDEVKTDMSNVSTASTLERSDKISSRTRGSSSPFRCISGLVQQVNQEKDHNLSSARLRIEELEALAASRYKEVCMLNTRLATAESMTHDVIRDLLSVKLDISNYANIIDHHQLQKLIEEGQHHRQDIVAMEQEILYLRSQIEDLLEERERCYSEIDRSKLDQLTTQIVLEQLQERDQMLIAHNEMLKLDKHNLQKRVAELDDMVKKLFSMEESQPCHQPRIRRLSTPFDRDFGERSTHSQRKLSNISYQLAQHRGHDDGARPDDEKVNAHGTGTRSKGSRISIQNHLQISEESFVPGNSRNLLSRKR